MVALKGTEIERYVARPDPSRPIVLVYGPDAGLVRERTEALIRSAVDDPGDPFQLARLQGDELASEPTRLVEEANTVPLFGGRRAVWVQAGSRNFASAVEMLIASAAPNCRVVIEAGELRRNTPLRTVCERASNAVTLPCYSDSDRDLVRLIEDEMRSAGVAISREARDALLPLLGGDRLSSRQELRKLALFAYGKGRVDRDDVLAVVADASALALDELIDAAFAGRTNDVDQEFGKAQVAGVAGGTMLSAALRQLAQLHKAVLAMDEGASVRDAANGIQPFPNPSRRTSIETALRLWTPAKLERAMERLAEAARNARQQPGVADIIAQRALLALAQGVKRRE